MRDGRGRTWEPPQDDTYGNLVQTHDPGKLLHPHGDFITQLRHHSGFIKDDPSNGMNSRSSKPTATWVIRWVGPTCRIYSLMMPNSFPPQHVMLYSFPSTKDRIFSIRSRFTP